MVGGGYDSVRVLLCMCVCVCVWVCAYEAGGAILSFRTRTTRMMAGVRYKLRSDQCAPGANSPPIPGAVRSAFVRQPLGNRTPRELPSPSRHHYIIFPSIQTEWDFPPRHIHLFRVRVLWKGRRAPGGPYNKICRRCAVDWMIKQKKKNEKKIASPILLKRTLLYPSVRFSFLFSHLSPFLLLSAFIISPLYRVLQYFRSPWTKYFQRLIKLSPKD